VSRATSTRDTSPAPRSAAASDASSRGSSEPRRRAVPRDSGAARDPSTASDAAPGRVSAPSGMRRPRVRRSEGLDAPAATNPPSENGALKASRDVSRASAARASQDMPGATGGPVGLSSRTRHELDRAGARLRERFAYRPAQRRVPSERWRWSDERARAVEQGVRELLADAARHHEAGRLEPRAARLLEQTHDLLGAPAAASEGASACAWCGGPMPGGLRPEARFCKKACRQASSRARLKDRPARSPSPPPATCSWCGGPMPAGLRAEARFCGKRCRQASSRFSLGMRCVPGAEPLGPGDTSPALAPASATRRRPPRREVLDDVSRAMRFCYADPPYPGKAGYYPEGEEVDHRALVELLAVVGPDGWALSTSATALQQVLAPCPPGVRVCSWHRGVRPTRSKRPISAWEPLIVSGGRELPTDRPQQIRDALAYGGRYRRYPGAMVGMKPPQFAAWMFAQLGARPGDQLVDLYPGSGAVGEAWRRYSGRPPLSLPAAPSPHCRACFGHSQPCTACVAAAGDPAPEQSRARACPGG
jgi:hypothetical protein